MNCSRILLATLLAIVAISQTGCDEVVTAINSVTATTWHQKYDWKAKKYFKDEKVIALCNAIEAKDIEEIDRLIADGADVNAKGKGNMTPLLWAFPDNKPDRFKRLLEHGADPNVTVKSDFNTKGLAFRSGDSITHMAAKTKFPNHFKYVMQHGGDANLVHPKNTATPLFSVIRGSGRNKQERIQLLIDKGANLDHMINGDATPAMEAVGWFGQFGLALMLLEAGADLRVYRTNQNSKLIHSVVRAERRLAGASPQQKKDYAKLVTYLEEHGESVSDARKDLARWESWGNGSFERMKRLREAEIAERLANEKVAKDEADTTTNQNRSDY